MKLLNANINGLKSAVESGFFDLRHVADADVLCLQETSCEDAASYGRALGYNVVAADRIKPEVGRAPVGGVAIFSRLPIAETGLLGAEALAARGQFVSGTIDGFNIASIYVTLDARPEQFTALSDLFAKLSADDLPALACGDMNTFRDQRDAWSFADAIKYRKVGCDRGAMAWFAAVFEADWIDAIESDCSAQPLYTWWHSQALFDRGDGTRVDYILASKSAHARVVPKSSAVTTGNRRGGHAQISLAFSS